MQQIADWLEKLGMSEYAECFARNDIDFTILSELTDQDLEKIGVASLGHRRKLLRAIASLEGVLDNASPSGKAAADARAATPKNIAERRQVTVMFSDLVGSTALSARMDPEDLREVISAYQKCVVRDGGSLQWLRGEVYGRWRADLLRLPSSARGRCRPGSAGGTGVGRGCKRHQNVSVLQTRVGIATGLVVVGDLIGSGEAQERSIVGETPNLAARLQSIAEPNMIVIAEGTRSLLGNLFELEELGDERALKGSRAPLELGLRCDRLLWKAASRLSMRAV